MGKLGKKARKFAKKHLQSVLKNRRKTKAFFKKRSRSAEDAPSDSEEQVENQTGISNGRSTESENVENISLDAAFIENLTDEVEEASEDDGYLSEDSSHQYVVETETGETPEDETTSSTFSAQNKEFHADLAIQKKKLDRLRKKDPEFRKFLESFNNSAETFQDEDEYSDEGDSSDQGEQGEDNLPKDKVKHLISRVIDTWCQMVTDSDTLAFAMSRLRASLIFLVAFPSLIDRLIKAAVHLWATGARVLSSAAFLVLRDIADMFSSNFDTCLSKAFVAFISVSRATEITDIKHMQHLRDCMVELCSLDVHKSSVKAVASMSQLAKILSWGLQTKKKEAVRKICSWEYVNCIDVWVRFISANIRDYDLQSLFFMAIQLINGVAHMFPGPRYFPLRLKCVEWLNHLASSSGNFIPLASLVLDILEYKVVKEGRNARTAFNIAPLLKLPKHYLKSRSFQDECFHSAIEQLSLHFAQWSHHISFPDLATIPLIRLGKVHEVTNLESLRRILKRFIDQVEQNVDFVQKKRDDLSFSPHDQQSADSFLQLEKSSLNAPFTQYYKSVLDKSAERNLHKYGKISLPEQKGLKRIRAEPERKLVATDQHVDAEENDQNGVIVENGTMDSKRRRKALKVK
ncbi:nucleolar complex protein 2 homolog [Phtheirospermum japonicum]|uniref:Nucleolar complex protein 2 homolog n=1 Tax=Phtheirospermum japonicum TaxID=374723 RepID=A0A830CNQ5_9LAMI|nr:nucleolar complex protein 2 homolog [Phtheirospermum japonicum]